MKAKIKVGFSAKYQVTNFNPIEQNDSIEIDYENEEDLSSKIEKWNGFIQEKTLKNLKTGVSNYKNALEKIRKME